MTARTVLLLVCLGLALTARGVEQTDSQASLRSVYKELVEINTTLSEGSCTKAAQAMAERLRKAGLPASDLHLIVPADWPEQGNLIAVYPGTNAEANAILLLAHIDVVEANRADWERDPFTLIEENGYFYGRGTADDKAMAAIFVELLGSWHRNGYRPDRTIKLALTCGEETPNTFNGVRYLLENHRDLLDAEFALNEGGGGRLDASNKKLFNGIQAGEKIYQDFSLVITNPGGHSSRPLKDNAIYRLAKALGRIEAHEFPIEFADATRAFFERMSEMTKGQAARDMKSILKSPPEPDALARMLDNPTYNAILRTTCVTTMLDAGHAPNALPQRASANVNCRIFPGTTQEAIRRTLQKVVADEQISVSFAATPESTSPPPPLTGEILGPIEKISAQMWPAIPVLPSMIAGGTDGRFLTPSGIPTYGVSGLFMNPAEVNAHGLNEKILVSSLYESHEFLRRLIREYAGGE